MTAMMNPPTEADLVRRNNSEEQLMKIERQIAGNIRFYSKLPEAAISRRICELEGEWSVERWLGTNAYALAFSGVTLGLTVNRRWFALPILVTGFLFQHAIQGWCPPVPVLRKLGVRTRAEIDREKYALKILRGDFQAAASATDEKEEQAEKVLAAVNA